MRPSRSRFLRRTLTLGLLLIVYRASVTVTSIVSFISRLSRVRQTIKYPGVQLIARASTIHGRIAAARRRHQRARYGSATEAQRCSQRRRTIQRYHVWITEPLGNLKWFSTQPNIAFAIMQHDVLDLRWNCNAGFSECRDNDLSKNRYCMSCPSGKQETAVIRRNAPLSLQKNRAVPTPLRPPIGHILHGLLNLNFLL